MFLSRKSLILATLLASTALPAIAAEVEPVIVTADRTPEPLSRAGVSVSVIDAATLEERQTVVLSDLIAATPGVSMNRNGGVGGTTGISLRGAETAQTVVLIDGVKLNDPAAPAGGYDFSNLLAGDVDQVEIVRGPQSTLWGGQAIGGVINILSATPTAGLHGGFSGEYGSLDTQYLRANVSEGGDRLSWRFAGSYYKTTGVQALDARFGSGPPNGYLQSSAMGGASYRFTDWASLDLRAFYVSAKANILGYPPPSYSLAEAPDFAFTRQGVGYAGLNLSDFDGRLKSRLAVQYTDVDRDNTDLTQSPDKTFYARGRNLRFEYQGLFAISKAYDLVFGAEQERSLIHAQSQYDLGPQRNYADLAGVYGELRARPLPGLSLTFGLRNDHHNQFGDHGSGRATAAYTPNGGDTVWHASFGQGFKAPSLYELYSSYGNTTLKPEQANGWDAGVRQRLFEGRLRLAATYFGSVAHQQIDFFSCPFSGPAPALCATEPYGYYANMDRTRTQGVELEAAATPLKALNVTANYTYLDAQNRSPGYVGLQLNRRPRNAANVSADYKGLDKFDLSASLRYTGESFDNVANTLRLKSYVLVDLRAAYPLSDKLEIYGRVENLFDKAYATAYQYANPGRTATAGLRAKF